MSNSPASDKMPLSGALLVVDDTPENLGFLFEYLAELRLKVLVALDGEEALEQLEHVQPDLILLDVMMPGIDGFETCRRIKSNPRTRDIPVIFMTALIETEHKLSGFASGAVDYVTKPLSPEELLARVGAQLSIRRLQRQLEERNSQLAAFGRMLAHDVRMSLNSIVGIADLLLAETEGGNDSVEVQRSDLELILSGGQRIQEIMEALLLLSGFEDKPIELGPVDMRALLGRVQSELASRICERGGTLNVPGAWPTARGYAPWIERIWINYIENALKYGGTPPVVQLGATRTVAGRVRFWVRDNGPGIPLGKRELIFQPFVRLDETCGNGQGIGLSIVRRIVDRLGGTAGVDTAPEGGAEFYFELPAA